MARVITAVYFLCFYVCLRRWRVNLFSADAYIAMPLGAAATAAVSIVFLVRALVTVSVSGGALQRRYQVLEVACPGAAISDAASVESRFGSEIAGAAAI